MQNTNEDAPKIEIPFQHRHHCWFCGEPNQFHFCFPPNKTEFPTEYGAIHFAVIDCPHPKLQVPCCRECLKLANNIQVDTIWRLKEEIKRKLIFIYRKDLAIGLNWTKEELAESEFEGGNFEGFKRSAWFMYEVAKGRVNFKGWPLIVGGLEIQEFNEIQTLTFDGMTYPSIEDAVEHYCHVFKINKDFFDAVIVKVGVKRFAYAVRYCRLFVGGTPLELKQAVKDVV